MMKTPTFRDVEQLSALLDGKLPQPEAQKLESRLRTDPALQAVYDDLNQTRSLLRRLPQRKAPRNFTLTPRMAGVKPPAPRAVPVLRFATVLATFLLVFSMATNLFEPALRQMAQAPVYGMGGGGGGDGTLEPEPFLMSEPAAEAPAATLLPPEAAPDPMSTLIPTLAVEEGAREMEPTLMPDASLKTGPAEDTAAQEPRAPVPMAWLVGLLAVALLSGGAAWFIRRASERSWRERTK